MFGVGPMELILLAIMGILTVGIPIATIVLLVLLLRKKNHSESDGIVISQLRDENQRLRDELAAAKRGEKADGRQK